MRLWNLRQQSFHMQGNISPIDHIQTDTRHEMGCLTRWLCTYSPVIGNTASSKAQTHRRHISLGSPFTSMATMSWLRLPLLVDSFPRVTTQSTDEAPPFFFFKLPQQFLLKRYTAPVSEPNFVDINKEINFTLTACLWEPLSLSAKCIRPPRGMLRRPQVKLPQEQIHSFNNPIFHPLIEAEI